MYTNLPLTQLLRRKRNHTLLEIGAGRKAYDLNDGYVLKVAKNKRGVMENYNENFVYNNSPKEIQDSLCPIIQFDDKYVIMSKVTTLDVLVDRKLMTDEEVAQKTWIEKRHIIDYLVNHYGIDAKEFDYSFNWGLTEDGKIVIIDYGKLTKHKEVN